MSIYKTYQDLLVQKKAIDTKILETQVSLYKLHADQLNKEDNGTINVLDRAAGYKLTVVKRETVLVDQKLACQHPQLFKIKYSFNKKDFDASNDDTKRVINACLTTKAGKPSFAVEVINDD